MKKIIINIYLMIIFSIILIGCSSAITITYIINNEVKTQEVLKNTTLENITFYGINEEYIEELYKDKNYTIKYNNEKIKEDTIIYIKLKQVVINFHIDNTIIAKNISMGSKITNDILPVNIDYIEGIYLDESYTVEYTDFNFILDNNIDFYIKMKQVKLNINNGIYIKEIDIYMGTILTIDLLSLYCNEKIKNIYYDNEFTKPYNGEPIEDTMTIYIEKINDTMKRVGTFYNILESYELGLLNVEDLREIQKYYNSEHKGNKIEYPEKINKNLKKQIVYDFAKYNRCKNINHNYDEEIEYYGTYNDCVVVKIDGCLEYEEYPHYERNMNIDLCLYNDTTQHLYVWKPMENIEEYYQEEIVYDIVEEDYNDIINLRFDEPVYSGGIPSYYGDIYLKYGIESVEATVDNYDYMPLTYIIEQDDSSLLLKWGSTMHYTQYIDYRLYLTLIFKDAKGIIGYAVIEVNYEVYNHKYNGKVIKCCLFPKINNERQEITEEMVYELTLNYKKGIERINYGKKLYL